MIRMTFIAAGLAGLMSFAGCASTPEGNTYYEQGDANYDALKKAHDACAAKGGTYQLKHGGDPTHLGDFECVGGRGK